ncbi:hypothetical protein [uncultured Roseovarius sp.]|uniref:hypothetical protein n=1 Tax=uncultured Roseovarius sp. TaxID=293344 RepID=UPI0025CDBE4F|nr:hypothetical protein [uncultured Roseovarius sp.]
MSQSLKALAQLVEEIEAADAKDRPAFEPRLSRMIDDVEAGGEIVPARVKCLHEELVNEKIEAQFDNMPV